MSAIETSPAVGRPVAAQVDAQSFKMMDDPFTADLTTTSEQRRTSHRYSSFDTQLFAQSQPSASPAAAKRALEAHLSETDRRLEEVSKFGTALVQQRKDLSDRLGEVEQQQGDREIGPALRQKLVEVEREYNELGRDSARAFLAPKARHLSSEEFPNGGESKVGTDMSLIRF